MSKAQNIQKIAKGRKKKERFISARMWFSTLLSHLYPDRVRIPANIGNNIFVGNNSVVTKNSISQFVLIKRFSTEMPIGWQGKLVKSIKSDVPGVYIDFITKVYEKRINPKDKGLESRVNAWYSTIENPEASSRNKKDAARLLNTYTELVAGEKYVDTIVVIRIRAKDGLALKRSVQYVEAYLRQYDTEYKVIKSKLNFLLEVIMLTSQKSTPQKKDITKVIQSLQTIAEALPLTQGRADKTGAILGINMWNSDQYIWNFMGSGAAKNVAVYGLSGTGKTYLVKNWLLDFFTIPKLNILSTDIKGDELTGPTRALGGYIVPCRPDTGDYLNVFNIHKDDCEGDPKEYYGSMTSMAIRMMTYAVDPLPEESKEVETVLISFLRNIHLKRGVTSDNKNTWMYTDDIKPLGLAKEFREWSTNSVREAHGPVIDQIQERFDIFFDPDGSKAYLFQKEYNIKDILNSKIVSFDFGMLNSSGAEDIVAFNIKSLYYSVITNLYCLNAKKKKEWTLLIEEEAQLADRASKGSTVDLMGEYANNFSLRRAQNVINVLLCNSFTTLKENPNAAPIVQNTNIVVIGSVPRDSREKLIKEYSLEEYSDTLDNLHRGGVEYANAFLIVNRSSKDIPTTLIKIVNPKDVNNGVLLKGVDSNE